MKTIRLLYILVIPTLFLSLHSCNDDDDGGGNQPMQNTGSIAGSLVSLDGSAISGALIEAKGLSTTSDADGNFLLQEVPLGDEVIVSMSKTGYVTNYKMVPVITDQVSAVQAALSEFSLEMNINTDQDNEIDFDGAKVKIPASGFVDQSGNPVTGNVDVQATYFDPTGDQYYDVFPGNFTGISSTGEEGLLESFGFIDVVFTKDGEVLDLAEGVSSEISIPIPQELLANAPNQFPCSSLMKNKADG
jgi:hypothetical protein